MKEHFDTIEEVKYFIDEYDKLIVDELYYYEEDYKTDSIYKEFLDDNLEINGMERDGHLEFMDKSGFILNYHFIKK